MSSKSASTPSNKQKSTSTRKSASSATTTTTTASLTPTARALSIVDNREAGQIVDDEEEEVLLAGIVTNANNNATQGAQLHSARAAPSSAATSERLTAHSAALLQGAQQQQQQQPSPQQRASVTSQQMIASLKQLYRAQEAILNKVEKRLLDRLDHLEILVKNMNGALTNMSKTVDCLHKTADVLTIMNNVVDENFAGELFKSEDMLIVAHRLLTKVRDQVDRDLDNEEIDQFIKKLDRAKKAALTSHTLSHLASRASVVGMSHVAACDNSATQAEISNRLAVRIAELIPESKQSYLTAGKVGALQKKRPAEAVVESDDDDELTPSQEAVRAMISTVASELGGPNDARKRTRRSYPMRTARYYFLKQLNPVAAVNANAVQQNSALPLQPAFNADDQDQPLQPAVTDDELDQYFA